MFAGNTKVLIRRYGKVDIRVTGPEGEKLVQLFNIAFCKDFAYNLVSLCLLRRRGF